MGDAGRRYFLLFIRRLLDLLILWVGKKGHFPRGTLDISNFGGEME
jgi:hypothetical protein